MFWEKSPGKTIKSRSVKFKFPEWFLDGAEKVRGILVCRKIGLMQVRLLRLIPDYLTDSLIV